MGLKDQNDNSLLPPSAMREKLEYQEVWFVCKHRDGYSQSAERLEGPISLRLARAKCEEQNSQLSPGIGYKFVPFRVEESRPIPRGEQKPGRERRR